MFRNLRIGPKLIIGFVMVALLVGVFGFFSFTRVTKIGETFDRVTNKTTPAIVALGDIKSNTFFLLLEAVEYSLEPTEKHLEEFEEAKVDIENATIAYKKAETDQEEVEEITEGVAKMISAAEDLIALKKAGTRQELVVKEVVKLDQVAEGFVAALNKEIERDSEKLIASHAVVQKEIKNTGNSSIVLTVIALLLAIGTGFFMSRSIANPVKKLAEVSKKISKGNFNLRAEVNSKDEVGQLAAAFNEMTDKLEESHKNLEGKVMERTKELEEIKKGLEEEINERKKAEESSKILKEKYENLYNNAPVMYMSLNMDGIVIECNKTISEKLGYAKSEMMDTHMTKFTTKESAERFRKNFPLLLETGELFGVERQLVAKDGKIIDVILNVTVEYDENKKPLSTRATFEDIVERKKMEEELRLFNENLELAYEYLDTILLNLPTGVAILEGPEFRYFRINKMLADLNGLSIEDHLGKTVAEVLPQVAEGIIPNLQKVLDTGEPILNREFSITLPKDPKKVLHLLDFLFPIKLDGKVKAVGAVVFDITARKNAEESLKNYSQTLEDRVRERTEELRRANLILSKFIADASHELRTPLAVAKSNVDLALRHKSKNMVDPYKTLTIVNEEIQRISAILSDLMMLSRTEGQTEQQLKLEEIDFDELLEGIVSKSQALGRSKNISISLDVRENLKVRADKRALEKLLMNLLSNAIRYGKTNGTVKLTLEKDDLYARITIVDNGIGIPQTDLPFIFERFYRVDKARSRKEGGTGLGLAIAKWIAEGHGGKIEVSSVYKEGSVFTVYVPIGKSK